MTRTIGIVNAGTLTVYDMNGSGAVELARLRIATIDPAAILAIIEGLTPYLAAQPAKAKGRPGRGRAHDMSAAVEYVTAHPGCSTTEIKTAMGLEKPTGSSFLGALRRAGLHSVKGDTVGRGGYPSWRWYADNAIKRAGKEAS